MACYRKSSPALAEHNHFNGIYENDDIEKQAMILDIVQVILQLFDRILHRGPVAIANLGPSGYSRLDAVSDVVIRDFGTKLIYKIWPFRTRSNKTHFAVQDIEYLGKLINP